MEYEIYNIHLGKKMCYDLLSRIWYGNLFYFHVNKNLMCIFSTFLCCF